jgi:Abnormal spindle-like microcephaly-assoc'd, ASPM-SPD-2-Hydin
VGTISTTQLSFGNQALDETSAARTVTLKNSSNGTAALTISGVTVSGSFAISANTCAGASLVGGKSCKVSVTFTPTVLGEQTGTLSFSDNAANSPHMVSLSGIGVEPMTLTPASANYAPQAVGTTSAAKTSTLTNNLPTALSFMTSFTGADPGDYLATNNCGGSVPAKGKCTISVTFTPQATGIRTATMNVNDTANNSPQTASLSGTGVAQVAWSPASLSFATQAVGTTSAAKTVTLTNNLPTALSFTTSFTGADPGDYSATNNCGGSVPAKSKCTISVTFTPQATGTRTATMNMNDSANTSPQTVSLTGTGK